MSNEVDGGESPTKLIERLYDESSLTNHEKLVSLKMLSVKSEAGLDGWVNFHFSDGSVVGYKDGSICPF